MGLLFVIFLFCFCGGRIGERKKNFSETPAALADGRGFAPDPVSE
jgi:hypothetical protein